MHYKALLSLVLVGCGASQDTPPVTGDGGICATVTEPATSAPYSNSPIWQHTWSQEDGEQMIQVRRGEGDLVVLLRPPRAVTLLSVSAWVAPIDGHSGLPGGPIVFVTTADGTRSLNFASDPSADLEAYEKPHAVTLGDLSEPTAGDYLMHLRSEVGTSSLPGLVYLRTEYTYLPLKACNDEAEAWVSGSTGP